MAQPPGIRQDDGYTRWGRGLIMLLTLQAPILDTVERIPLGHGRTLPLVTLLMFAVSVLAVGSLLARGSVLRRWWFVPGGLMALTLISQFGAVQRGGDALLGLAQIWSMILYATAVAIHTAQQRLERTGLLTALVLAGLAASLHGLLELLGVTGVRELFAPAPAGHSTWSLLLRPDGPMQDAEAFGWLLAVTLPVATAGVFLLEGTRRELATLAMAVIWMGVLLSMSYTAPIVALLGMLLLLLSRYGLQRPQPGITASIVVIALLMALNPAIRARWHPIGEPVRPTLERVTVATGGVADDSLGFILTNDGLLTWPSRWEVGYHVFEPERTRDGDLQLTKEGWVARPIGRRVVPGEATVVTLPVRMGNGTSLIALDMLGPGGHLAPEQRWTWLLSVVTRVENGSPRVLDLERISSPELNRLVTAEIAADEGDWRRIGRVEAWSDAFAIHRARPLFGFGVGAPQAMVGHDAQDLYLQVLVNGGWFGLIALLGMLLILAVGLNLRRTLETTVYGAILLVIAGYGLFDYVHDHFPVALLTATLLGMAWAAAFEPTSDPAND